LASWVGEVAGGRPGPGLLRLAGEAAGNPLYVTELVAALDRGQGLAITRGTVEVTGGTAPATLTEAIPRRRRGPATRSRRPSAVRGRGHRAPSVSPR
jgi:hypothetical protein